MAQYNKRVLQPLREFSKGGEVFVKTIHVHANQHQHWIYGKVIGSTIPRSCTVNTSMQPVPGNHIQITEFEVKAEPEKGGDDRLEFATLPDSELTETNQPLEQEPTVQ